MMNGLQQAVVHNECIDDFLLGYRNRAWSAKAWHNHKDQFCDQSHMPDFCAGFRQGYEDVAGGSGGCTPPLPPESYWGWRYQSVEGQGKVGAWFSGYPHGARAAEEDGIGSWATIRTTLPAPVVTGPAGMGAASSVGAGVDAGTLPEPAEVGSSALQNRPPTAGPAGVDLGSINIESLTRMPASSVPTAATGRTGR